MKLVQFAECAIYLEYCLGPLDGGRKPTILPKGPNMMSTENLKKK